MQHILTIESSATQRYVLNNTLEAAGFAVIGAESADIAEAALAARLEDESKVLEGVVLSWPDSPDDAMNRVMSLLDLPDHHDLPVLVLSQPKQHRARAWVDGRSRTRLLDWRHQRNTGDALNRLLGGQQDASTDPAANDGGLSVLVVDDSPSIRLAFGDLMRLQGYRVEVACNAREALDALNGSTFDIAVVDFYLGEHTGDVLIRKLIAAAGGHLACAVLTSNYTDHIIQQSLSAGAVACLFKNEPGDLLLARLEGIGRLVADQAQIRSRNQELEALSHAIPGMWIHIDKQGGLLGINQSARRFLAIEVDRELPPGTSVGSLHPSLAGVTEARIRAVVAEAQHADLGEWSCRVLDDGSAVLTRRDVVGTGGLHADADFQYSVLLLACEFSLGEGKSVSVAANAKLLSVLTERLQQRVIQADRIAYLGHGIYTVTIAHRTDASGIVAARQLMMTVVGIGQGLGQVELHSFAAVVPSSGPNARDPEVIKRARDGALEARKRGPNHVYIANKGVVLNADPRDPG